MGVGRPDKEQRDYGEYDAGKFVYSVHTAHLYHIFQEINIIVNKMKFCFFATARVGCDGGLLCRLLLNLSYFAILGLNTPPKTAITSGEISNNLAFLCCQSLSLH